MTTLQIRVPGQTPQTFGPERPLLTVGRSSQNDLVIEDASLSRLHARFSHGKQGPQVEDLGSLNGTFRNGQRIHGAVPVAAGDEILLGTVLVSLATVQDSKVLIESPNAKVLANATLVMNAEKLRRGEGHHTDRMTQRWPQALKFIQELTLELIRDVTPQQLLEDLVAKLFDYLGPERGVVLLKNDEGAVEPVVVRTRAGSHARGQIRLSQTLVDAAMERHEALLINDPMNDPALASKSLIFSGVSSIIVTPLEAEGQVIGLLYFDAMPTRAPFSEDDLLLVTAMAHVAAAKIQNARLMVEVTKKRALEQEMAIARTIQQRLLPHGSPSLPNLEIHGGNRASRHVSGDLFGFWPLPDGSAYVVIADVSGKGIGPGLLMATFQAYMSAWAELALSTGPLAERLSQALALRTTTNRFITGFLVRLRPDGTFTWTSAGHNPGLILRAGGTVDQLPQGGLPLAMLPGMKPYLETTDVLRPGDLLCLYTDGITEAEDPDGEEFGLDRLVQLMRDQEGAPLATLEASVHAALEEFTAGAPPSDDRTVVLVRRTAAAP